MDPVRTRVLRRALPPMPRRQVKIRQRLRITPQNFPHPIVLPRTDHTPRRGHGRHGAAAYTGARRLVCADPELSAGERCPARQCRGHLYDTQAPSLFIRLEGRPTIAATQYEQQVLRCAACQTRFTAPLPEGVSAQKYDATADVAITLYKYGAGMPFYRQARLQAMCGVPMPESVQYARCAVVSECVRPVYEELVRQAAQAEVIHTDDTRLVILDLLKENNQLPAGGRRAVQTSGIVARTGDRQIALYVSGRRHAGENLAALLSHRPPEMMPPLQMSDALSANWTGEFAPRLLKARKVGMSVHQQHRELVCGERVERFARRIRPPCEMSTREPLEAQPEALTIVDEKLESGAAAVTKQKDGAGERVSVKTLAAERGERLNAFAEIHRVVGEHDL